MKRGGEKKKYHAIVRHIYFGHYNFRSVSTWISRNMEEEREEESDKNYTVVCRYTADRFAMES